MVVKSKCEEIGKLLIFHDSYIVQRDGPNKRAQHSDITEDYGKLIMNIEEKITYMERIYSTVP